MNNCIGEEQQKERITILVEMAGYVNSLHNGIFKQWTQDKGGCKCTNKFTGKKFLEINLEGNKGDVSSKRTRILAVLQEAQNKRKQDCGESGFQITLELLVPYSKVSYIIGTDGKTIKSVKSEAGVGSLYIETKNLKPSTSPLKGWVWVMMRDKSVETLKAAHQKIVDLVESSDPRFKKARQNDDAKQGMNQEGQVKQESFKIPGEKYFSPEQQERLRQIEKDYPDVKFTLTNSAEEEQWRFLTLSCAKRNKQLMAKTEVSKLVREIRVPAAVEERISPAPGVSNGALRPVQIQPVVPTVPAPAPKVEVCREVNVPSRHLPIRMMGERGKMIKQLEKQFHVKMNFLGESYLGFSKGRTLRVRGDSEQAVDAAIKCVEEIIEAEREKNGGLQQAQLAKKRPGEVERTWELPDEFCDEAVMAELQKNTGFTRHCYRSSKNPNSRTLVLQGTDEAVGNAVTRLKAMIGDNGKKTRTRHCNLNERSDASMLFAGNVDNKGVGRGKGQWQLSNSLDSLLDPAGSKQPPKGGPPADIIIDGKDVSDCFEGSSSESGTLSGEKGASSPDLPEYGGKSQAIAEYLKSQFVELESKLATERRKVKAMAHQMASMHSQMEAMRKVALCVRCKVEQRTICYVPCSHLMLCGQCATSVGQCPVNGCGSIDKLPLKY